VAGQPPTVVLGASYTGERNAPVLKSSSALEEHRPHAERKTARYSQPRKLVPASPSGSSFAISMYEDPISLHRTLAHALNICLPSSPNVRRSGKLIPACRDVFLNATPFLPAYLPSNLHSPLHSSCLLISFFSSPPASDPPMNLPRVSAELLLDIFSYADRPSLVALSLVDLTFFQLGTPLMYRIAHTNDLPLPDTLRIPRLAELLPSFALSSV
jgi:hypothetical protein